MVVFPFVPLIQIVNGKFFELKKEDRNRSYSLIRFVALFMRGLKGGMPGLGISKRDFFGSKKLEGNTLKPFSSIKSSLVLSSKKIAFFNF